MRGRREIEIKLPVADIAALKKRLGALGARLGKRVHECNVLFDTPNGRFRRRDELVRLRANDGQPFGSGSRRNPQGKGVLTFKGRSVASPKGRKGKYKVRFETEFSVSDYGAAAAFLRGLGLVETFRYEKYRTEVRILGASPAHICLDETPIGAYFEIEGSPAAIDRAARMLGYKPSEYITRSYLAIYAAHCRARRIPMRHFVFAHRKKSPKASVLR